jgi:signal transduction histidine kinase
VTNTTSDWGNLVDVRNPHGFWRFAGIKATSQWVVLPIMGFLSLNVLVTAALSPTSEQLRGLSAALIAFAAAWLFFTLTALIVNLVFSRFGIARIIAVLVMYGLTEYVRIRVVHEVTENSIMLGENTELYTFVGAVMTGIVMCSIAATATFDSSLYKTDYSELVRQQLALSSTVRSTERSVEQTRSQLLYSTKELLTSSLELAFAKTKAKHKNYAQVVDELFRISDEVIRPLSRELTGSIRIEKTPVAPIKPQKVPLRSVLSKSNKFSSFNPIQFTITVALISAPGLIVVTYLSEVFAWFATIVIVFLAHYLSRKFVAPVFPRLPKIVKAIITSLVYSLPVGLLFFVVTLNVPATQGLGVFVFIYGSLVGLILGWLIALSDGFRYARAEVLLQLTSANNELLWNETRLQSQLWLDQKRLALIVHNDVQATILSAGLSLKKAIQSGDEAVKKQLPALRKLISSSLQLDQRDQELTCIEDVVSQLNNTWGSLMTTTLSLESNASTVLAEDSLTTEVCSEIIREFVTNSLKHGQATLVTIHISIEGDNTLAMTLVNNGKALSVGRSRSGLGTHFLEAVTLSFLLSDVTEGVQLQVEVPLATSSGYLRVAAISS